MLVLWMTFYKEDKGNKIWHYLKRKDTLLASLKYLISQ